MIWPDDEKKLRTIPRAYFFVFLLVAFTARPAAAQSLLPAPKKIIVGHGQFPMKQASLLITGSHSINEERNVQEFIDDVRQTSGISIPLGDAVGGSPRIVIVCEHPEDDGLAMPGEEGGPASRDWYHIHITSENVTLKARTSAGLRYALQSLRQLVRQDSLGVWLPETDLEDYPAFACRGVMLDLAHGGLLTVAEIKRQIDFLSRWKINQYYLYSEVSLPLKGYPLLHSHGGYSKEEISSIIAFGRERAVDVIPFVNFYGHLHELLRIQKYAALGVGRYGQDLDPRSPEVQRMLKDWIKQYAALFPSPFIHIGFDETSETQRLSRINRSIKPETLYIDHLQFVSRELSKYGKTPMVWTDISKSYPGILSRFPRNIIPVVWDYGDDPVALGNWIKPVVKENLPFFIQSAVDGWAHIYPTETTWGNIDLCLRTAAINRVPGYITSVWTDALQPLLRNTWIFLGYGAALSWSGVPVERQTFISDYCRITYPAISEQMKGAFSQLAAAQVFLRKCLGQTQTHMWENPFLPAQLLNTRQHLSDFEEARRSAENAEEFLMDALDRRTSDSTFVQTLLLNSRLLAYAAMRFLWAEKMDDRWNESLQQHDDSWYSDIAETPHGLIMDMLDYCTELKTDYEKAWLSENMPYRLGTVAGRFDWEYAFWRRLSERVLNYHYNEPTKGKGLRFARTFGMEEP